jgi:ATP-binding cassette, subfamily B, bacterial MsbA
MKSIRRLLPYLKTEVSKLLLASLCMLLLALSSALYAAFSGPALNFIFTGKPHDFIYDPSGKIRSAWQVLPSTWLDHIQHLPPSASLWIVPSVIIGLAVLKGLMQAGQFQVLGQIAQKVLLRLRQDAFSALMHLSPSFYDKRSHGDLVSRLTNDASLVEQAIFYGYSPVLRDGMGLLCLLGYCFYSDPKLSLITFITIPLAVIPLARFSKWLKKVSLRGQEAQGEISSIAYEALAGHKVVQAFNMQAYEIKRLLYAGLRYYREMLVSYMIRAVRTPVMETLGAIAFALLLAALGHQVQARGEDPAHYISFFFALLLMYEPIKRLGKVSEYVVAGAAAADRIFEIIDHLPDVYDHPQAQPLPAFGTRVVFDNVGFSYKREPVLCGFNLEIQAGQLVALVGQSGSGKTTLAHLLARFYDVTTGRILVDGHDIRDLSLHSLRQQLSVVGQDTFLFNKSIADNIAYGKTDATQADILRASQAAYADEFIERLPEGYRTIIGERGLTLSGGQRQRLAIARALICDKPLLILDEATSALDVESERYVQKALDTLMQGRTSLVIAHRLSTVRHADKIIVLKSGLIVEHGTHDALLTAQGEYARLYQLQFMD